MAKKAVSAEADRRRMTEILKILKREYPESQCSLLFSTPFQLLVATILSAQCTDARVNQVTPVLFARFPTPAAMAAAELAEIEALVRSTNFFRNKAKAIQETSKMIMELHAGEVPQDLEMLINLRGVGRKTANVVLGVGFGVPGLVVDTHVKRLSFRMGFTRSDDPVKIEQDLMKLVPEKDWTHLAHLFIDHGRAICTARRAWCEKCPVALYCPQVGVGH